MIHDRPIEPRLGDPAVSDDGACRSVDVRRTARRVRGGAVRSDGLAPWPAASAGRTRCDAAVGPGRRVRVSGPVLFDNPVCWSRKQVRHACKQCGSGTIRISPRTVDPYGCADPARREPMRPRTRDRYPENGRTRVARRRGPSADRDRGPTAVGPSRRSPSVRGRSRSGGRIGVVKLLRARGGCLGVIRIRAWKAAKSPGELPNERRSRNARGDPGN